MKASSNQILPAAVLALAGLVAVSATVFGFRFAPEAHGHGAANHAEAEEEEGDHAEERGGGQLAASILISIGGALVPLAAFAARRREPGESVRVRAETEWKPARGTADRTGLALLSVGAAVIHFAVIAQHWDEWWLTGTFFVVVAAFQLAWAALVLLRPSRFLFLTGAIVNALVVVTWIVSRTTGVPLGPSAGEPEAVGLADTLATAYELLLVAGAAALVTRRGAPTRRRLRPLAAPTSTWLSAAAVVGLTALALALLP